MVVAALARFALAWLTLGGCSAEVAPPPSPTSRPVQRATGALLSAAHWQLHGSGVSEGAAVPIEDVLAAPASFVGKDLRVTGRVEAVCKIKGSWLVLGDAAADVRVTFKDDAFLVPLDCDGREAILEGRLHAKAESAVAATDFVFIADGVALRTPSPK